MIDYASHRVDSDHEEFPKGGRTWCDQCGWVDRLDPNSLVVALWHGDSFGHDVRPLDDADILAAEDLRRASRSANDPVVAYAHEHGFSDEERFDK